MENDGKEMEKLIHLINKSIEPESNIEHNVFLPVIGSASGRKRQCDILITSGPSHRKTLTLVETQDRTSKVDINTFNGWLEKLTEVGAQHLICVSRLDFPESIKEKAYLSGNKVKLVTMKEIAEDEIPFDFLKLKFKYLNFKLIESKNLNLTYSRSEAKSLGVYDAILEYRKDNLKLNFNDKIFSLDQFELKCLYNICRDSIQIQNENCSGLDKIAFDTKSGTPLYLFIDNKFLRIGLEVEFKWENEAFEYPVSLLTYEQGKDGSLAWVFEGQYETIGGKISFKLPIIKTNGKYQIAGIMTNLPDNHELLLFNEINK